MTVANLHAWYCENDRAGAPTHVAGAPLPMGAVDSGDPDARGGVRVRHAGGDLALVACKCGGLLRRAAREIGAE